MDFPLSRAVAPQLDVLPEAGSTNAELVARASGDASLPDFSVIATTSQTAGRGRLGRTWVAPPGKTLAVSVLLRPAALNTAAMDPAGLGWLPLLAGLAMTRAVASLVGKGAALTLKWPNDVQVDGLKVSGLLAELVPAAGGVVIGAGLNLFMTADELPTPTSTSLTLVGANPDELLDRALAAYLAELRDLYLPFAAAGLDARASGLRDAVTRACSTIGRSVRVELPGGSDLFGTAVDIDELGRLVVSRLEDARREPIAAGDVTHLRYE